VPTDEHPGVEEEDPIDECPRAEEEYLRPEEDDPGPTNKQSWAEVEDSGAEDERSNTNEEVQGPTDE
jgi:hypothetical protein